MTDFAQLLSVVPVSDFDVSHAWYERLFARPADNVPMPGLLAEWRVADSGWVQVSLDAERAGHTMLNFAEDDLHGLRERLAAAGFEQEDVVEANRGVRLSAIVDPDGNRLTFIGGFREEYFGDEG